MERGASESHGKHSIIPIAKMAGWHNWAETGLRPGRRVQRGQRGQRRLCAARVVCIYRDNSIRDHILQRVSAKSRHCDRAIKTGRIIILRAATNLVRGVSGLGLGRGGFGLLRRHFGCGWTVNDKVGCCEKRGRDDVLGWW